MSLNMCVPTRLCETWVIVYPSPLPRLTVMVWLATRMCARWCNVPFTDSYITFPFLYRVLWFCLKVWPCVVMLLQKRVCLQWIKIKAFLCSMCVLYMHFSLEAWEFVYLCFTGWLLMWKTSANLCFMSVIQCKNVVLRLSKVLLYLKALFINNFHISIWSLKVT